jgi:hypothetical protein
MAVGHLGIDVSKITSIVAPTSDEERACALFYDICRQAVLRKAAWNFARKRATVSRDAESPPFGYTDAYNLPNDFVRILAVNSDGVESAEGTLDYSIESGQILMNADGATAINIQYIYDNERVVSYDPIFVELLSLVLASRIGYWLNKDEQRVRNIIALAFDVEASARETNSQETPIKHVRRSRYTQMRYGNMTTAVNEAAEEA